MKVYIGADHRGFVLKEKLYHRLVGTGFEVENLGNDRLDPQDDYVDFAHKVAKAVASDWGSVGIILCGSGVGVDMVANKIEGIRSALVFDVTRAKQSREHEDANVLSLPADVLDEEKGWDIVQAFLAARFSGEERHVRRLQKLKEIEKQHE